MNREEAIEIFKRLKENAPNEMHLETVGSAQELFDMAIQALSQESEIEENIIKYMKKYPNHVGNIDFWEGFYACRNVVLQLDDEECSPKEQEPCDDAVSREAVIKCIERGDTLSSIDHRLIDKIKRLPSVTQSITRDIEKSNFSQEQYLLDTDSAYQIGYEQGKSEAQKSGKWITLENRFDLGDRVKCSECGQVFVVGDDVSRKYCPNCGAKMVEPQESEVEE